MSEQDKWPPPESSGGLPKHPNQIKKEEPESNTDYKIRVSQERWDEFCISVLTETKPPNPTTKCNNEKDQNIEQSFQKLPKRKRQKAVSKELRQIKIPCPICGDLAITHIHYGGFSCFSCKAFFRRMVSEGPQKVKELQCKEEGSCVIDKKSRKNCRACRYQVLEGKANLFGNAFDLGMAGKSRICIVVKMKVFFMVSIVPESNTGF